MLINNCFFALEVIFVFVHGDSLARPARTGNGGEQEMAYSEHRNLVKALAAALFRLDMLKNWDLESYFQNFRFQTAFSHLTKQYKLKE